MKRRIAVLAVLLVSLLTCFTACGGGGGENGEVYVYCYGDYFDEEIIAQFEEETGISVVVDYYDTAEEMYPVVKNNSVEYDAVCTSDYMIDKLIQEDLLAPVDKANIPNLVNIDEKYLAKSLEFDPDNTYSVPYMVGVSGIIYNKSMVGDLVIDSWEDLWDAKFTDSIVMPDSVREDFMIALMKNGYSLNTANPEEIDKAAADLKAQKPLVYKYANDSARDLLADGSAAIGVVWNGEYIYTKDLNDEVEFVVPKEGTEFFIVSWFIPKTAKNKENAEKWIDFLCRADVAKTNFDYLYYTTPNKAAMELIEDEYKEMEAVFPSDETLARCQSLRTLDEDTMDLYANAWKQVKAN
ncbi:MAG: spermidine/putrescine ABC transporter substrate-binding protein [Mogibacterium sp.]|nr:spermidine/putrescine ABC transporter substrate-binding protein [Mogibacterium sp.]